MTALIKKKRVNIQFDQLHQSYRKITKVHEKLTITLKNKHRNFYNNENSRSLQRRNN